MGYYDFPHTRNYDTDLGYLINWFKTNKNKIEENTAITIEKALTATEEAIKAYNSATNASNSATNASNSAELALELKNQTEALKKLMQDKIDQIDTNTSKINTNTSRINNLATINPGSITTTADAELVDIRVGANGITYPSAGGSVRGQISEVQGELGYKLHDAVWNIAKHSFDAFTDTISSGYWGNNKLFTKGYVKSISAKTIGNYSDEKLTIVFLNENRKCIFSKAFEFSDGVNEFDINTFVYDDFYVLIRCNKFTFTNIIDEYKWVNYLGSIDISNTYNIEFNNGGYKFGFIVNYETVTNVFSKNTLLIPTTKKIYNKVFACGDSITATYPTYNDEIGWVNQVGKSLGLEMTRGAASGNGYVYSTGSGNAKSITNDTDFRLYDFALYAWGTNDYGNNSAIGTIDDDTPGSEHLHLYGVLHWIIRKVLSDNVECTPILITPINRSDYGTEATNWAYGTPNELGYTLSDYCDAIVNIAKYYGIPYVDNRISPFTRVTTQHLLGDNLHPTELGYKMYGKWLSAQLSQYIRPYVD